MSSTRRKQVFFQAETQPGVTVSDASLFVAANGKVQAKDPQLGTTVEQYQREISRASLAPLTSISGIVECEMSFIVEASGVAGGTATSVPVWSALLESCGFRATPISAATIAATFAGTSGQKVIEHSATLVGNTESASALGDTWEGQARIRYFGVTPDEFDNPETLTVTLPATTTITATTTGAGAAAGRGWFPVSSSQIALDVSAIPGGAPASGDLFKGTVSGAILVARATIAAAAAQAFELMDGTVNVSAGETLTNLTQAGKNCTIGAGAAVSQTRIPTLTMGLIEDGVATKMTGARGTVSFSGEIGKPVFLSFTFKGTLASISDRAPVIGIAYDSQVPPKFMGATFRVGSQANSGYPGYNTYASEHTPRITSFSIDYGSQVNIQKDATQTNGTTVAFHTATRQGKGQINPEVRPEASFPTRNLFTAGSTFRMRCAWGTVDGNRFLLAAPSCKSTGVGAGDRDGFATTDIGFDLSALDVNGAEREDSELIFVYSWAGGF
jgi:hypothetical protein